MAVVTAGVVSAGAAAYGAYSSSRAARQQGRAGDQMAELSRVQAERQGYYDQQLRDLLADPSQIYQDPGYQESFRQGQQAVERSAAAGGFTGSGNAAIALQRFGQSFASDYMRQQQQLLASLSGAQFNPASAASGAAGAYGGAAATNIGAFGQLGSALANLGYTFGGGGSGGGGSGSAGGFGTSTSVPGTMNTGGGYIVNIPGTGVSSPPYIPSGGP